MTDPLDDDFDAELAMEDFECQEILNDLIEECTEALLIHYTEGQDN